VDTLSGLLFKHAGRVLKKGDRIDLGGVRAEVLEMQASRARRVRLTVTPDDQGAKEETPDSGR
jgi:CBS domain containing-hemolysin-like protein